MKIRTYNKPPLSDEQIDNVIDILRIIYGLFTVIGSLYIIGFFISLVMGDRSLFQQNDTWEILLSVAILTSIYFGLRNKTKWVIPLILIYSVFSMIWMVINVITPAKDMEMIIIKFVSVIMLFFFIYQMKFFSRNEVKSQFNTKGFVLFQ